MTAASSTLVSSPTVGQNEAGLRERRISRPRLTLSVASFSYSRNGWLAGIPGFLRSGAQALAADPRRTGGGGERLHGPRGDLDSQHSHNPALPALHLPSSRFLPSSRSVLTPRAETLLTPRQRALREAKGRLQLETLEQAMRRRAAATGSPAAGRSRTVAFYVNWDDASLSSLRQKADFWGVRPCLRLCRRKPGSPRLSLSAGEAL
jgi:hypothetical protein